MKRGLMHHGKTRSKPADLQYYFMLMLLMTLSLGMFIYVAEAQTDGRNVISHASVKEGDEWKYHKGTSKPPRNWNNVGLDDGNWRAGPSGIGYGIGSNRTYLGDMKGNYGKIYARNEFTVSNLGAVHAMKLAVVCDGPFIAYLNGIEVIRTITVQISPLTAEQAEQFDISGFSHELFPGANVIAIECSNDDINSEDFSLIPIFDVLENEEVQK